ncbi:MAG: hypothetical protein AB7O43_16950 [Hyphomicrobiaceae bacterium]
MDLRIAALSLSNLESAAFFATLILWWSFVRPAMVRDFDNRRLPPNPTARFLFSFLCVLTYGAFFFAFLAFREAATSIGKNIPVASSVIAGFKDQAPLLAAVSFAGLLQLSFIRDIERQVLVWLHSRRHLRDDAVTLGQHLQRVAFVPSAEESARNRETARKYGVYVTDESVDGVGLVTFANWRKVASLLRSLRKWMEQDDRAMSEADLKRLKEIETSHERKTQLAMTIVKMVDGVSKDGEKSAALGDMLKLLSNTHHIDRSEVAEVEARVKNLLTEAPDDVSKRPLRLSGAEFKDHLRQIEGYFQVEYEILLEQVSDLAARATVMSGEHAPVRLEQLKAAGFPGLGRIERINFDRILWLFLVIAIGGFLVFFLGNRSQANSQGAEGMARFAFIMAISALIGAVVGSRRSHVRAPSAPWSKYIAAGILAGALFIGVNLLSLEIKEAMGITPPPGRQSLNGVGMLPWALLPCLIVVAIAALGRFQWPGLPDRLRPYSALIERTADGVVVSVALFIAFMVVIALHTLLGLDLPRSVQLAIDSNPSRILPYPVFWTLQVFGFIIGFFTARDVRRAAHTTIIADANAAARSPMKGAPAAAAGSAASAA